MKFETLTDNKTGKKIDGVTVAFDLDITDLGKEYVIPSRLIFIPNAKGEYRVADIEQDKPILK